MVHFLFKSIIKIGMIGITIVGSFGMRLQHHVLELSGTWSYRVFWDELGEHANTSVQ